LRVSPSVYLEEPSICLPDLKYAKNDDSNEAFFKRIAQTPDKQIFLNLQLDPVFDGEFEVASVYSNSSVIESSLINFIKFDMPSVPPLYNWNQMKKVSGKMFSQVLYVVFIIAHVNLF
jgi:hypothetical protein